MTEVINEIVQSPLSPLAYNNLIYPETVITFRSGNKDLLLTVNLRSLKADTCIVNNACAPPIPGTTTSLYRRAKDVMEEIATVIGKPISYCILTRNPNMKKWIAESNKGASIFNWEETGTVLGLDFFAKITINPISIICG